MERPPHPFNYVPSERQERKIRPFALLVAFFFALALLFIAPHLF